MWTIPPEARGMYRCYGVKVTKVKSGVYTSITRMKMWMQGPALTEVFTPVDYAGGAAGASSFLAGHTPQQAFALSSMKGTEYPWANLNTAKFPHTVWYKFPRAIQVAKFGFSSRYRGWLEQAPQEFQFVGSDDCTHWKTIASYKTQFTKLREEKTWTIPPEARGMYHCYGVKVTKVKSGVYTSITRMKMWMQGPAIAKREIEDNFAAAEEEGEEKEMAEKAFDEMLQEEDMKDLMMEEEREAGVVAE